MKIAPLFLYITLNPTDNITPTENLFLVAKGLQKYEYLFIITFAAWESEKYGNDI